MSRSKSSSVVKKAEPPKKSNELTPAAEKSIESLFEALCDEEDPEIISMDGISQLCTDIGIDPATDVRALTLMWTLGAVSKPGAITKAEFISGLKKQKKFDVEGIKSMLPSLDPGFLERNEFRDFYRFVFQFSREGTHKTIEKDMVIALLPIVLDTNRAPHLTLFLEFLQTACTEKVHQRITLDQWDSFLQFSGTVKVDLSNHEDDGACNKADHAIL
eukprot:gene3775-5160_t